MGWKGQFYPIVNILFCTFFWCVFYISCHILDKAYNIYFFLLGFVHWAYRFPVAYMLLQKTGYNSILCVSSVPQYRYIDTQIDKSHLFYPLIHWCTSGLIPYLSFCELSCNKHGNTNNSLAYGFLFLQVNSKEWVARSYARTVFRFLRNSHNIYHKQLHWFTVSLTLIRLSFPPHLCQYL